ncbi:hypothetical protein [Caulobacter sp. BK020]|uniref:hypothetical protein n=1 Tax=Caulobacter sp. BK020 TaxID=2512117 RepID=UPI00104CE9EA|nr:hypothetical protein [Caulobacter sp. BK020]TCS12631.1 hypothetical protein EV278_11254 [Caulobacter sp. BK020]
MASERGDHLALKKFMLIAGFIGGMLLSVRVGALGGIWSFVGGLGTVAASLAFAYGANRLFRREPLRPPMRRYLLRFGISMSAYVVLLIGAMMLHRHGLTQGPLGYLIALAPAAAILGTIASMGFYLAEETDEFHREVLIQSLLWGMAVTLGAASVWGFLETFGKAPHAPAWAVVPVFAVAMGLSQPFIARRYR